MGLSMKNVNIMEVNWKIRVLEGGAYEYSILKGGIALKRRLGQFEDLKGGGEGAWQKRRGSVFEREVDTPMQHKLCLAPRPQFKSEFEYISNELMKILNIFSPEDLGPIGSKRLTKSRIFALTFTNKVLILPESSGEFNKFMQPSDHFELFGLED